MSFQRNPLHIGTYPSIESLQIYTAAQAEAFQKQWQGEIDYIRSEWVSLPDTPKKELAIDLTLRSADGQHSLIVFGILVKGENIILPSLIGKWHEENLYHLVERIQHEILEFKGTGIKALHPDPRLPPESVSIERAIPGLFGYLTAIHHIKRYNFISRFIRPGNILECACGAGYGAVMLSRLSQVTGYYGIDLSSEAVFAAQGYNQDERFSFHVVDLAEPTPELYQNIISLETIEHVLNPYRFVELLIDKMAPDAQLLVSLPAETWGSAHLNPYHISNWNRKRLITFFEQYFEDISIFAQKLSFLGPSTFEASEISDSPPNEDYDEDFIAVLRGPRKRKRPNIVLKRRNALGDVIWTTPILHTLRRSHPCHNVLVVTEKTEVFIHNPDADLVFNTRYEPLPDDLFVDLDWAYDTRREQHLLHAYLNASGVAPISFHPALYPSRTDFHLCATHLLHGFRHRGFDRIIAVHMAASSPDRIWPRSHWRAFIMDLLQRDQKLGIVVLGNDKDFSAADLGLPPERVSCLVRRLSLMQTVAMLSLCDLLVAPDSGVLHIAAAVGTPCLGLFNMADPATRLPFSTGCRALWTDIECRGCLREIAPMHAPLCPRGKAVCMERILPEETLSVTQAMLEAALPGRWTTRCQMVLRESATERIASSSPNEILESGIQAFGREDFEMATEYLAAAMERMPENPLPCAYLAFICARQALTVEARDFIVQAIHIAPERADLIAALGETFLKSSKPFEAAAYLQEAVQKQPDLFAAYPALARSLQLTERSEEAISLLQSAANLPSGAQMEIQNVLLQILAEYGDLAAFTQYAQRFSRGLADDLLVARCLARFDESGEEFISSLSRVQAHLQDAIHANPDEGSAPVQNDSGLTRIAFMVGEFTTAHQIAQLCVLLRHLPPERFFTLLFSSHTQRPSDDTVQICGLFADADLQIQPDADAGTLEKIRTLAPDILIDTEVYAPSARLDIFLSAPARHKFLWAEAPMPSIAPGVKTLAGARLGVESMLPALLLPEMGEVFDLPEQPLTDNAARTWGDAPVLGCLVPAASIARSGWQLMAQALRACPGAKLVINLETLGERAREFICSRFAAEGLETERLVFVDVCTMEAFCLAWQSIDLGLLPPVHHGGLALPTCLWMGKPCLAPASALPWSQRPAALLKALGQEEWIADEATRYAKLARDLVSGPRVPDPTLRERMKALGLDDAKRFAHGFAQAMPQTA